jgi:hypothetical protein
LSILFQRKRERERKGERERERESEITGVGQILMEINYSRAQSFKTFYGRNLQKFVIS